MKSWGPFVVEGISSSTTDEGEARGTPGSSAECGFSRSVAKVPRTAGRPSLPVSGGGDRLPEQRISARTKSTRPAPQMVAGPPVVPANEGVQMSADPIALQAWAGPTRRAILDPWSTPGLVREQTTGGMTGTDIHSPTTRPSKIETTPRSPTWVENGAALPRRWGERRT